MPDSLSALVGAAGAQADAPAKKKLRKVGDHWEDEAGVKYADEAGTIALKMDVPPNEVQQAKAGAPAQSAMDTFGVEKATGTGGWAPQGQSAMASGGGTNLPDSGKAPEGMSVRDITDANTVLQAFPSMGPDKTKWYAKYHAMSPEEKKSWLARAKSQQGA